MKSLKETALTSILSIGVRTLICTFKKNLQGKRQYTFYSPKFSIYSLRDCGTSKESILFGPQQVQENENF